jgi:kynurenine formamidase
MCLADTAGAAHGSHDHQHHHDHDHSPEHDHGVSRRRLLAGGIAVTGGALAATLPALPAAARGHKGRRRVVDLTHRLVKAFPVFDHAQPTDEVVNDFGTTGYYSKRWAISEHTGTHIDTPGHFSQGGRLVDELTPDELIVPIVVIDIKNKARQDPNATVDPDDLQRWERRHGRIPRGALVAANSGWAAKAADPLEFLGGPAFPEYNFPGWSIEGTDWLLRYRDPVGIGVDTVSLDPGNSTTFDVHVGFLGADRYGIENLNGLDRLPPRGAEAFVGPIPWEDGSGSPCRVLAVR